jgi:hypothetical protein
VRALVRFRASKGPGASRTPAAAPPGLPEPAGKHRESPPGRSADATRAGPGAGRDPAGQPQMPNRWWGPAAAAARRQRRGCAWARRCVISSAGQEDSGASSDASATPGNTGPPRGGAAAAWRQLAAAADAHMALHGEAAGQRIDTSAGSCAGAATTASSRPGTASRTNGKRKLDSAPGARLGVGDQLPEPPIMSSASSAGQTQRTARRTRANHTAGRSAAPPVTGHRWKVSVFSGSRHCQPAARPG